MRPIHRAAPAVLAAAVLALPALNAPATAASHGTGVRLFTPDHSLVLTVHNSGEDQWIEFNAPVYVEARKKALEIDVRRKDAGHPITATVRIGDRTRTLPRRLLNGWNGLRGAFLFTWTTPTGALIQRNRMSWCPNDGQESRLRPTAATQTRFTFSCSSNPFTRGQRWGVDRGWSRQINSWDIATPANLSGHVKLEVALRPRLARAFGIPAGQDVVHFDVAVQHVTDPPDPCDPECPPDPGPVPGPVVGSAASRTAHTAPADRAGARHFSNRLLPDLVALPAWGIATHNEDGHDLLDFAATVYNGGRGPLVAEGFRRGGHPVMDAYQFFYRGDRQVASARVGTMEYDARPSHQHWHFEDFATYDLVNRHHARLRTSGKEAFCLAPTDAINLLQPGAVVDPGDGDLSTACGDISSVWVREVLASGWGDTYSQQRAGQSIDITGLRNGSYWIRVTANPAHRLYEASRKNNVSLRRVILGGTPGHRTVEVPRYGLIDSESFVQQGGGF